MPTQLLKFIYLLNRLWVMRYLWHFVNHNKMLDTHTKTVSMVRSEEYASEMFPLICPCNSAFTDT